ncbi:MAG: OmpW family protein [Bacteroidales bacterium]|nr:OmpW family protein [Bacteroidales bacterium]
MKKTLYILLFTVLASSAMAQNNMMSWQYSIGFASGDLHDYVEPVSWRGVTYNYHRMMETGASVGMELGWNVFYEEKAYGTYSYRNLDYSGKQYRYSNNIPLLITIGYFVNPDYIVTPFAGIGIGTMYSERKTAMGVYTFASDGWHFEMKPELGIMYNREGASLALSAKYYYGLKAGDLPAEGFFAINIGFVVKR